MDKKNSRSTCKSFVVWNALPSWLSAGAVENRFSQPVDSSRYPRAAINSRCGMNIFTIFGAVVSRNHRNRNLASSAFFRYQTASLVWPDAAPFQFSLVTRSRNRPDIGIISTKWHGNRKKLSSADSSTAQCDQAEAGATSRTRLWITGGLSFPEILMRATALANVGWRKCWRNTANAS